jgi:DNA polymerase elongation subunit (family B)
MINMQDNKITFQISDWDYYHPEDDVDDIKKFTIRLFGRDKQLQSIYLEVTDFNPYFYIKMEDDWKLSTVNVIMEEIKKKVKKEHVNGLIKVDIEKKHDFYGFTNYKLFNFVKLTFNNFDSMKQYSYVFQRKIKIYSISRNFIKFKIYESNILPLLRFMHTKNLDGVGWISVDKKYLSDVDISTCSNKAYKTKWTHIEKIDDKSIVKLIILSYDIECKSEDGSFPQAERDGDKITQIGMTLSRYGETECYERHLLSLQKTSPINGVIVQSFDTEEELILAFPKMLRQIDPDIITGWNIFGFDFNYLRQRAIKLSIIHRFERLSRINNEQSLWVEDTLQSAAMGKNIMNYYKMTGRVLIDLMKVVQRDYKLSCYKLDYVASYFIRETVINFVQIENDKCKILTTSTYGVNIGQFIIISYEDGAIENKYNDGEKFEILEINKDNIIVSGFINTNEILGKGYKISWCQAKDDISPQDIFKMVDRSPEDRAIVGKYCIMDCELVSKLMAKLQIITNNVSMANVCNVPLSYLFLRGQGIKIFSLVSKKCREKNHLIPVIKKKQKKEDIIKNQQKDLTVDEKIAKRIEEMTQRVVYNINNKYNNDEEIEEEEEELGYEGAIVFQPKPGVYYQAIIVLDYGSLYPSSMIFRNLSHECLVNDPKYDNLKGYIYHTITYKIMTKEELEMTIKEKKQKQSDPNKKDEFMTCRFAEKMDGTKGIIPEILMDLLSARKKYKKLMETEKDPFMKTILDGLQLAYKVTANSLYGQTGASTSPICMKEIAASTTATGREMLQFSKYFIEGPFTDIINTALISKNKYYKIMDKLYKYFPTEITYNDVNRATNKSTKVDLHVCTNENLEIPENKFIVESIEFEEPCEFKQSIKDLLLQIKKTIKTVILPEKQFEEFENKIFELNVSDRTNLFSKINDYILNKNGICDKIYKSYSNIFNILNINDGKELKNNFLKPLYLNMFDKDGITDDITNQLITLNEYMVYFDNIILLNKFDNMFQYMKEKNKILRNITFSKKFSECVFNLKVCNRNELFESIEKYLINKSKSVNEIYDNFEDFWIELDISCDELKNVFLKPLKNFNEYSKEIFINNLKTLIKDIGYNGKTEMFDKFYDFVIETYSNYTIKPEVIYGDTDSVFFRMNIVDNDTNIKLQDEHSLKMSIKTGVWSSILITTLLPKPQSQAYEKVLMPFVLQGKKRYTANLYEKNPHKFKQKSMGIEMKRRDNANIVKIMCAGIIDQILNHHSSQGAYDFARNTLHKIITGEFKMDKFIITKTLKGNSLTKYERKLEEQKPKDERTYVDRTRIVHAVLADRMADRDPGNKPMSNDRIPYMYVEQKHQVLLQGDRVESPEYIIENKLKIDYLFYITNQVKTPALKFLDLLIENANSLFEEFEIKEENRKNCMIPIEYYIGSTQNEKQENQKEYDDQEDQEDQGNEEDEEDVYVNFTDLEIKPKKKGNTRKLKQVSKFTNNFTTDNLFD